MNVKKCQRCLRECLRNSKQKRQVEITLICQKTSKCGKRCSKMSNVKFTSKKNFKNVKHKCQKRQSDLRKFIKKFRNFEKIFGRNDQNNINMSNNDKQWQKMANNVKSIQSCQTLSENVKQYNKIFCKKCWKGYKKI